MLVVIVIVSGVTHGYRKGFVSGLISAFSCFFSFLFANFFGKFILQSSIFGFLSSLKFKELIPSQLRFPHSNKFNNGFFDGLLNGFNSSIPIYLIFWVAVFVLLVGFKRLFKELFFLTGFIKKIPIISSLDGLLGALFGVMEAAVFLIAAAFGCSIVIILTGNSLNFLNSEILNSTKLFFLFYRALSFFKFQNFV